MKKDEKNVEQEYKIEPGKIKEYVHKFRKIATSKAVITYVDKREEMPKVEPNVELFIGTNSHNLSLREAYELSETLTLVLAGAEKPEEVKNEKETKPKS